MAGLLTCSVLACAHPASRINFDFPQVPPEPKLESVVPERGGIWMNEKDAKADLEYRAKLQSIIDQLRVYWERTHGDGATAR